MIPRILEPEVMDTVEEAVDYDSMDHREVNRTFVRDLLSFIGMHAPQLEVSGRSTVVDLGTGTALIPLELLSVQPELKPILGCDLSIEMLKLATQHIHEQQRHLDILPVYCDCKHLPLTEGACDVVLSNSIVHHIPEPVDLLREIRRVIKPGGVLFVRDLMRPATNDTVERFVATYTADESAHQQQLFRQSLHAALTVAEVRQLLVAASFDPHSVQATSDRHWTIACIAS